MGNNPTSLGCCSNTLCNNSELNVGESVLKEDTLNPANRAVHAYPIKHTPDGAQPNQYGDQQEQEDHNSILHQTARYSTAQYYISVTEQRLKKLSKIVNDKEAPILYLKVSDSFNEKVLNQGKIQKGKIFRINAQGLEGSIRAALDGCTYFGCKKRSDRQTNNTVS